VKFISDKEGKSWDVVNPEALKGYEDQRVVVTAEYANGQRSIRVLDVKVLGGPGTGKCPPCKDDKTKVASLKHCGAR